MNFHLLGIPFKIQYLLLIGLLSSITFIGKQYGQKRGICNVIGCQYAGGVGLLSVNAVRTFFAKSTGEAGVLLGYVPGNSGKTDFWTFGVRYRHCMKSLDFTKGNTVLFPVGMGLLIQQPMGQQFLKYYKSSLYPDNYYWFAGMPRVALIYDIRLTQRLRSMREITLIMDWYLYDLYAFSWYHNRNTIPFSSLFITGLSIQYKFR
jgi:hypothetical protein